MPTDPETVHQLKISLLDIEPPIWRRVLVPSASTLAQVHEMIQAAMGWEDSHLHEFEIQGTRYAESTMKTTAIWTTNAPAPTMTCSSGFSLR